MRGSLIVIEPENPPHDLMRAAGGVICRDDDGIFEVAVIHRPHREDWSFPKGKLDPGETFEQCALRETLEETGLRCELDRFVGVTEYIHRKGRPKIVAYWLMRIAGGEFTVNPEADELRWCNVEVATTLVTYERDRELLELVAAALDAKNAA